MKNSYVNLHMNSYVLYSGSWNPEKKNWMKNIIFSWRNLDFKIEKIMENPLKSNQFGSGRRALHMRNLHFPCF